MKPLFSIHADNSQRTAPYWYPARGEQFLPEQPIEVKTPSKETSQDACDKYDALFAQQSVATPSDDKIEPVTINGITFSILDMKILLAHARRSGASH